MESTKKYMREEGRGLLKDHYFVGHAATASSSVLVSYPSALLKPFSRERRQHMMKILKVYILEDGLLLQTASFQMKLWSSIVYVNYLGHLLFLKMHIFVFPLGIQDPHNQPKFKLQFDGHVNLGPKKRTIYIHCAFGSNCQWLVAIQIVLSQASR
ncbi:putative uncharacterized protein YnbD [Iris pallida]|uniref:Uncharacterized protein n=1 Tax=Iris pallida TaxID=29817 RepID=A0AAX6DS06_IRIPA|nr:putative uncharacterized protein YnbD [Iris pallida]KAJ6844124.1 putative uncharacterized protein YnbD [Iris pallida]